MKWNQIFNRGKRVAQAEATGSLHSLLLPSVLGIAVCMLTLCSLTWAWFTVQVHTDTTTIQSAYIHVYAASSADAFVPAGAATQDAEGDVVTMTYAVPVNPEPSTAETEGGDDTENKPVYVPTELTISGGKFYFVAQGTAQKAYLKIIVNNTEYFTTTLNPTDPTVTKNDNGNDITPAYTVYCVDLSGKNIADTSVTLSLCWGDNTNVKNPIDPTPAKDNSGNDITITSWPGDTTASINMLIQWPEDNSETTTPDGDTKQDETLDVEEPKEDQPTGGDQTKNPSTPDDSNKTPAGDNQGTTQGGGTGGSSDGNTTEGTIGDSTNTETGSDGAQQNSDTSATPTA